MNWKENRYGGPVPFLAGNTGLVLVCRADLQAAFLPEADVPLPEAGNIRGCRIKCLDTGYRIPTGIYAYIVYMP